MRTRSFICVLLLLTTTAFGGQRIKPAIPHDLIRRIDPFASPRTMLVRNPQLKSLLERHQFPTRVGADQFLVPPELASVAPTFNRNDLHRVGAGTSVITSQSTRLAPFDTVYEQGYYGTRRYVYSYDGQGNTLLRSTQVKSAHGWDEMDRIVCTYTPTGVLEGRTEYITSYQGGISERDLFTYNFEGLMTSSTRECFDPVTGRVQSAQNGSTVYDAKGNRIYYQWESWYEGEWTGGSKVECWLSDSLQVDVTYGRTPGGWIPVERWSYRHDLPTGDTSLSEIWDGSHWINNSRTLYTGNVMTDSVLSTTWTWEEKAWTLASRCIFVWGGDMVEYRYEDWKGRNWIPESRQCDRSDEQGRTVYSLREIWDNAWHIDNSIAIVYGADGGRRDIDSLWSDGALSHVRESAYDSAWHYLGYRDEVWHDGAITHGFAETYSYTATGRNAEVISSTWAGGKWELFYRYALAYDENDHIRSLRHYIFTSGEWEPSYRYSAFETTDYSGSWWDLDNYADDRQDRKFDGFSELTFAYRAGVSAIAQAGGTVPERSTLRQNYPNPFNPTTTIPFAVSTGARTTLVVFDVLGREIARPVDEWKDPGEYIVKFDASDLASGMYICRFTSGAVSQTSKLMLVR